MSIISLHDIDKSQNCWVYDYYMIMILYDIIVFYYFFVEMDLQNPSRCQISRDVHWDTRISFWHVGQVVCPHGVPDSFRPSHHPQRLGLLQGALGSRTVKILPFTIAHSMSLTFINQDHSNEVWFVFWGFERFLYCVAVIFFTSMNFKIYVLLRF